MKNLKGSKAYGAFEYVVIIALVIVLSFIVLNVVRTKATGSGSVLDKALGTANMVAGGTESPGGGGEVGEITITYSGPFNYGYEKDLETAVDEYFTANAEVKDKDSNVRTDYVLDNISKVGGFIQVELSLDGETVTKQISFNNLCLATDVDFSGETDGEFEYHGTSKCVEIPNTIKGVNVTSYSRMFDSTNVEKVISDNLNVTNMNYMFYDSQSTSLDLSNLNTSNVTSMYMMFRNSQAESLDLSNLNTSNVINMHMMFSNSQATSLDLSNFNTSKVVNMAGMFESSQATSIDLSSFNTSSVTDMVSMFSNSHATSLDLSNFNTENVIDMSRMFEGTQTTEINLTSFNLTGILGENLDGMLDTATATNVFVKDAATQTKLNTYTNKGPSVTISVK